MTTILVMAKAPVAGRVKTRLCPPFTLRQAADLALAALLDTLDAVLAAPAERRVLVLEGPPGPWLPPGIEVLPQQGADLDERIANALAWSTGPVLLIGMDTPQVTDRQLTVRWDRDAWFGPAADGGFWALGLREPDPELVRGVPMSRNDTGRLQLRRLSDAGLRVGALPELRDIDTAADAAAVASAAPHSRFAVAHAAALHGSSRTAGPGRETAGVH
jgi:glycosyltransferase A (GT-A) superfamily protein (DUF2064 family)